MSVQLSGRATIVLLCAMVTLWSISYSPLLARLWPILRGSCAPVPGPVSRWADVWGMGWMRFHDQLVREVQRADQGKVRRSPCMLASVTPSCACPACTPTSAAAGALLQCRVARPFSASCACDTYRMLRLQGYDLVFYGDSISEDWRGTSGGYPWPVGAGTSEVFQRHFARYHPEVLAIAGKTILGDSQCHAVSSKGRPGPSAAGGSS